MLRWFNVMLPKLEDFNKKRKAVWGKNNWEFDLEALFTQTSIHLPVEDLAEICANCFSIFS